MLAHTLRVARRRELSDVTGTQGDARMLPYTDASSDAAYLITVLGEITDQRRALAELRRVLKPSVRALRRRAEQAGLHLVRRSGPPLGYLALLRPV